MWGETVELPPPWRIHRKNHRQLFTVTALNRLENKNCFHLHCIRVQVEISEAPGHLTAKPQTLFSGGLEFRLECSYLDKYRIISTLNCV